MIKVSLIILFMSSFAFSQADLKLSKDEFLKKVLDEQIVMNKDPMFPVPEDKRQSIIDNFKRLYPTFKNAYWFVPNLRTNKYLYTVFYEWPNRKCIFRVEELDSKSREVKKESIDPTGVTIDIKYCEKAYGVKIN